MENTSKQEKVGLSELVRKNVPVIVAIGGALALTALDCVFGAYRAPGKNIPAIHELDSTYLVRKHTSNPMIKQDYFAKRNALWEEHKHNKYQN